MLAARHYGPTISLLAGAVQATTAWTVLRGRLAEADVLLACLITWSLVAFDQMLLGRGPVATRSPAALRRDGAVPGGCSSACWVPRRSSRASASARRSFCRSSAGMLLWQRDGVDFPPAVLSGRLAAGRRAGSGVAAADDRTPRRRSRWHSGRCT